MRRIVVREAIDFLRSQKGRGFSVELSDGNAPIAEDVISTKVEIDALQGYIDALPEGYKTVLILYAVEGYKHAEIAQILQISEGTSKSQLSKARKLLSEKLKETSAKQQWK